MSDTTVAQTPQTATEGPAVAVYPSARLRPVPPFVFAVPKGWVLDEAPDALAVVRTPQQVEGFWVNALITSDRVAASVDLEAATKATWARVQRESPGATVGMERVARFGKNDVYLRGIELEAPQSKRKLAQIQALFLAPPVEGARTTDVFQIIGTSPSEVMQSFGPVFVALIASFEFVCPPPPRPQRRRSCTRGVQDRRRFQSERFGRAVRGTTGRRRPGRAAG
jgi:hypothetical protein